ncbi:MAG TPA: 5'-deoxynucleotidase [Candidatus Faecousia intestinigallinarum]|nr:5'-deoxynucleotidase [Candidatus Faecousia intestinigallinarum]
MANEFFALMGRMRYITRWGLMRNTFSENIQEHSHQVAVLAHALALIRREVLGLPGPDPDRCAVAALYHDASEILTGDLPTPIKYYDPDIKAAYKRVEYVAGERLLAMLPPALQRHYAPLVLEEDEEVRPIVKAADKLSAYIKCIEEQKAGNREFDSAEQQTMTAMRAMALPELDWFLTECLPAYEKDLDQLR